MLGEAQLAWATRRPRGRPSKAIGLEPDNAAAGLLLARIRLEEGSPDAALEAVTRLVDLAASSGDFERAASPLRPVLEAFPSHRAALQKMAELREAEGDASESIAVRMALGRDAEARGTSRRPPTTTAGFCRPTPRKPMLLRGWRKSPRPLPLRRWPKSPPPPWSRCPAPSRPTMPRRRCRRRRSWRAIG